MLFLLVGEGHQINNHAVDVASKGNLIQRVRSNHKDKDKSVSVGTGMADLGGIGKTNSKQEYYIWRAVFTASTKRTQKVLSGTIWGS